VTLLARLAKSTGLRLLSGTSGGAPAAGIKLVSVLTFGQNLMRQATGRYGALVVGQCLFKDDMVTRQ
jgi:hypothetical protein